MNVVPKRRGDDLVTIPNSDGALVVECACVQPPSMVGRTVYVVFAREDMLDMLTEVRQSTIDDRMRTEVGRVDGG